MQLSDPLTSGSDYGASSPVNFSFNSLRFNGAPCHRVLCNGLSHREAQTIEVTDLKCSKRRLNCLETHEGASAAQIPSPPAIWICNPLSLLPWNPDLKFTEPLGGVPRCDLDIYLNVICWGEGKNHSSACEGPKPALLCMVCADDHSQLVGLASVLGNEYMNLLKY